MGKTKDQLEMLTTEVKHLRHRVVQLESYIDNRLTAFELAMTKPKTAKKAAKGEQVKK